MTTATSPSGVADLLVTGAMLVGTCDAVRRELPGGWVAVTRASSAGWARRQIRCLMRTVTGGYMVCAVLGRPPVPAG